MAKGMFGRDRDEEEKPLPTPKAKAAASPKLTTADLCAEAIKQLATYRPHEARALQDKLDKLQGE